MKEELGTWQPTVILFTPIVEDDYLLDLVESAKQIAIEFSFAEVGYRTDDLGIDEELVCHVVPVINDAI